MSQPRITVCLVLLLSCRYLQRYLSTASFFPCCCCTGASLTSVEITTPQLKQFYDPHLFSEKTVPVLLSSDLYERAASAAQLRPHPFLPERGPAPFTVSQSPQVQQQLMERVFGVRTVSFPVSCAVILLFSTTCFGCLVYETRPPRRQGTGSVS